MLVLVELIKKSKLSINSSSLVVELPEKYVNHRLSGGYNQIGFILHKLTNRAYPVELLCIMVDN